MKINENQNLIKQPENKPACEKLPVINSSNEVSKYHFSDERVPK